MPIINLKKGKDCDVYVGRGSKWGNPFKIGPDGTRDEVIEKYRQWLLQQPDLMAEIYTLNGKVLGCWCWPQHCHAEVLLEIAAQEFNKRRDTFFQQLEIDHSDGLPKQE